MQTNGFSGYFDLEYQFTSGSGSGTGYFRIRDSNGNTLHEKNGNFPSTPFNSPSSTNNNFKVSFEIDSSWDYIELEGFCNPCDGQFIVRPYAVTLMLFNDVVGQTGPAGADSTVPGPQGPQGPTGADGPQGVAGNDGADGDSAYDIWLSLGNTGTQQDFIDSLTGPQGCLLYTSDAADE